MRLCLMVTVAAVALTACTNAAILGPDSDNEGDTAGNTALFCRAWPDARETILGAVSGATSFDLLGDQTIGLDRNFVDSDATLVRIDRAVPAEVRTEWDRAYGAYAGVSDLLFVTGYTEGVIRPVHVTMAFGDRGPEGLVADAEAAVAAIDEWSITMCGDFCSRWPEFEDAVILDPHHYTIDGGPEDVERSIGQMEAAIRSGNSLVPPALADEWGTAAAIKSEFLAMYRNYGREALHDQAGEDLFRDHMGMYPEEAFEASITAVETMAGWVEAKCDAGAVTTGVPGSVSIRMVPHEHLMTRTVFAALLPAGTDFAAVRDVDSYLAVTCTGTYESPEEWKRSLVHAAEQVADTGMTPAEFALENWVEPHALQSIREEGEYYETSACGLIRHEEGAAIVPGGSYELYVGAYIGEPGNYGVFMAAPEYCTQFPVTVNGDTVIDLPVLEPCELDPIGRPEEIARRTPPPFDPGGTLRIEVDGALVSESFDQCNLSAVLLAAGTTLNDVGIGDVWPNGVFSLWRPNPEGVEGDPEARRWAEAPGLVPILPAPPSGTGEVPLRTAFRGDGPWDTFFPDPVPLAAGTYDLRIQESCHREGEDRESLYCGIVTVEVNGDTVVEMPELEDCSWPE